MQQYFLFFTAKYKLNIYNTCFNEKKVLKLGVSQVKRFNLINISLRRTIDIRKHSTDRRNMFLLGF